MSKISVGQSSENSMKLPPEEMAIREKCFHLSGAFEPFPLDQVDATVLAASMAYSQRQYAAQTHQLITEVENLSEDETRKALSQEH